MEHYDISIKISPETAPIYKRPDMDFNSWFVLPLIAFGVYLFLLRTILKAEHSIPLPVLLALAMGLKVMIDVSVTMINGHFLPLGIKEYFDDVPKFDSLSDIVRNYASKAKTLTRHSGTHPPGPVFALWIITHLFTYHETVKAFFIILTAPLALVPMYLLAEQFYNKKIALYTIALYLVTPNIVMYTATCMDAFFSVSLISSIHLFFYSLKKRTVILAVLTGLSLSVSMFLTFATTFLGVYFIVLTILIYFSNRSEFKNYLTTLLISGGIFCVFYLIMYLITGYNILTCLQGAFEVDKSGIGTGYETFPRYLFVSGTNLFGFFSMTGVPTFVLWLREVGKTIRNFLSEKGFSTVLLAYVTVLIPTDFSTLYLAETERIWIFMAPFVLIPAAKNLKEYTDEKRSERMFYVTIVLLYIQTLAFEVFIDTVW